MVIFLQKKFYVCLIVLTLFLLNKNIFAAIENISEKSGVVIDGDSGSVLYNKDMNKKVYPASTTKILTAIIAIENLNLNSNITITQDNINKIPPQSSLMRFKAGDTLTVEDLLYGLMLSSGNDAAIVLAEKVSGSIQNFSLLMNKKAKEIGALNSNFVNPHGYYNPKHYSSSHDMALIMNYASKNEIFRKICETKEYEISETDRTLENTNKMLEENLNYITGGKTGYVDESGNVFVSYAINNKDKIICALYDGVKVKGSTFKDTKIIYDNIFKDFYKKNIIKKDDIKISYLDKTNNTNYILGIKEDIVSMSNNETYFLSYNLNSFENNKKNITGSIKINCGNDTWNLDEIYNLDIKEKEFKIFQNGSNSNIFYLIFILICVLFILILINKIKKNNKKRRKLKKLIKKI